MKRLLIFVFALSLAVSLISGCAEENPPADSGSGTDTNADTPVCLTEEDGTYFITLPVSGEKVAVYPEQKQYVSQIDTELLLTAERSLTEQVSEYDNNSGFYLQVDDGALYLYVEVIVQLDYTGNEGGCGFDHDHKFFKERITNEN